MTKPTSKVKDRWNKAHYDEILIRVPKGQKEVIKQFAGKDSMNKFIVEAINDKIK